jgi:hypothetical protein
LQKLSLLLPYFNRHYYSIIVTVAKLILTVAIRLTDRCTQAATALALSVSETILGKMLEATSTSGGSGGSANNSSSGGGAAADASRYGHNSSNSTAGSVNGGHSIASNGDDVST